MYERTLAIMITRWNDVAMSTQRRKRIKWPWLKKPTPVVNAGQGHTHSSQSTGNGDQAARQRCKGNSGTHLENARVALSAVVRAGWLEVVAHLAVPRRIVAPLDLDAFARREIRPPSLWDVARRCDDTQAVVPPYHCDAEAFISASASKQSKLWTAKKLKTHLNGISTLRSSQLSSLPYHG